MLADLRAGLPAAFDLIKQEAARAVRARPSSQQASHPTQAPSPLQHSPGHAVLDVKRVEHIIQAGGV